ncbi:MAG TPA: hypothetical protein PLH36_00470, partial [Armatimonadota bacterium]|nr:hypothetical protein [Armatimonadota bacterium]
STTCAAQGWRGSSSARPATVNRASLAGPSPRSWRQRWVSGSIASTPWPAGDYNPGTANFGYGASSIRWLFGPQLLDLRYRDLKVDLAQPMYAVRSR